jgi:hypothetical protein
MAEVAASVEVPREHEESRSHPGMDSDAGLTGHSDICSKMVPVDLLQHDHLGSLQFCGSRHLGRHELAWCRRRCEA